MNNRSEIIDCPLSLSCPYLGLKTRVKELDEEEIIRGKLFTVE